MQCTVNDHCQESMVELVLGKQFQNSLFTLSFLLSKLKTDYYFNWTNTECNAKKDKKQRNEMTFASLPDLSLRRYVLEVNAYA